MAKIVSKAKQQRLAYALRQGETVSVLKVAKLLSLDKNLLYRIEAGSGEGVPYEVLEKLCGLYQCGVGDLLEYSPNERQPSLIAA